MKQLWSKLRKKGVSLLCLLLSMVLITASLCAEGLTVAASGEERTFDIGVNPESVTATLADNGLLTVKGSGAIRDFTAETAPFAGCAVTSIRLGADLTAIGRYTFYNCGFTGALVLPKGLLCIGDRAFSGESAARAPKPVSVENGFTEEMTVKKKDTNASQGAVSQQNASVGAAAEDAAPVGADGEGSAPETETAASEPVPEDAAEDTGSASQPESQADNSSAAGSETETGETETKYSIERIVQQEIGEGIFYPRTDGPAFYCSEENETFRSAMTAAGYREAESLLSAVFQCGKGNCDQGDSIAANMPMVDGKVILPGLPPEFSAPGEEGLYHYAFAGWTESKDPADTLRTAGSAFAVGDRTELYFIANWQRQFTATLVVQEDGDFRVFTAPALEGYDTLSYRWQTCVLAAGEKLPVDQEQLSWQDISGETDQSYRWKTVPTETGRLFRCVVTVKKQQNFLQALLFSADDGEEAAFGAVEALPAEAAVEEMTSTGSSVSIIGKKSLSGSISGENPVIFGNGSVTASFVKQYVPSGTNDIRLYLCRKNGETAAQTAFPAGTVLLLCDMTAGAYRYFLHTADGADSGLSLSALSSLDGSGAFAPPTGSAAVTEKLQIVVDFSGSGLADGEYSLALTHGGEQLADAAKAGFTVTAQESCGLNVEQAESDEFTWGLTVTPQIPDLDRTYDGGACVRLWATDANQKIAGFPEEMLVSGDGEDVVMERDGSLTFTMSARGTASMFLKFSNVAETQFPDGEYQLHAALSPNAGLQMGNCQGQIDASAVLDVSLHRTGEDQQRSVSVALDEASQRLLDVSEGPAELALSLSYRGVREGDTLKAEVLQKTGETPDDSSYSPAPGDWGLSPASGHTPSGSGETLRLTVPQNQEKGTYRLLISIVDASGTTAAKQPYNFIVK